MGVLLRCGGQGVKAGLAFADTKNPRRQARVFELAHPERFELPTKWFEATYSIQLSYGCKTFLTK